MSRLIDAFSHIEIAADSERITAGRYATGIYLAKSALAAPQLVVASSSRQAGEYVDELRTYLGEDQVIEFAPWETLPHEKLSPKSDTVAARTKVLGNLAHYRVIVTSVRALIQPISRTIAGFTPTTLAIGKEIELSELLATLSGLGYNRTDLVEKHGFELLE